MSQISNETKEQAMKIAKATQKPGQTKEQTKLISAGIEKGIAEYKKQQKVKARQRDKLRKQQAKNKQEPQNEIPQQAVEQTSQAQYLPWGLLIISWIGFASYLVLT